MNRERLVAVGLPVYGIAVLLEPLPAMIVESGSAWGFLSESGLAVIGSVVVILGSAWTAYRPSDTELPLAIVVAAWVGAALLVLSLVL
jgi:hypothetical protein